MRTKNRDSFLGIYKITNPEGLIYIGKSSDIRKRWLAYKYTMAKGQPKLNASFVEFGIGAHKFEIIAECQQHELSAREAFFIDWYNAYEQLNTSTAFKILV